MPGKMFSKAVIVMRKNDRIRAEKAGDSKRKAAAGYQRIQTKRAAGRMTGKGRPS